MIGLKFDFSSSEYACIYNTLKIPHFSFQIEIATQFRLELIKIKALAHLEDLVTKVVDVYKLLEKWLGERYLREMAR